MIFVVGELVRATGGIKYVFSHTMYIPIILAAYFFHIPGGVIAGVLGGLTLGPLMPISVATGEMQETINWLYRTLIFSGIGLMLGMMFSSTEKGLRKIEWLAVHAPDTGLPNQINLIRALETLTKTEPPEDEYALLAIRINNHAEITTIFSIDEANELDVLISKHIQALAPGAGPVVYHLYPQTFCVIRKVSGGKQEIVDLIERRFGALESPMTFGNVSLFFNISIGVTIEPLSGLKPSMFLQQAKLACLTASEHELKYAFYKLGSAERAQMAQMILGDIPRAVREDQFELYYQPIIQLASGEVIGMEALLRWHHPTLGTLLPAHFLPVCENTTLIFWVHQWVMKTTIQCASRCRDFNGSFSINLSTRLLSDQTWIEDFAALLEEYQVPASRIIFEVTESSLIVDRQQSVDTLTRLCDLGASIAIDDFGTGYATFEYIYLLPVRYLKIDRRFIYASTTSKKSQEIIKSMIHLADALGIETVAEGVETEKQLEWLREARCNYVQGFYISRPQPGDQIMSWLKTFKMSGEPRIFHS